MRRWPFALIALASLAGCGGSDPETPAACLAETDAYVEALAAAPGEVLVEDTTPIGDCLVKNQSGGELSQVGEAMIGAATRLNRAARERPGGDAALQLGYLVGAVQEAESTTGGIHRDLVLRLDSAARFSGERAGFPASFERAFGAGYAAGQAAAGGE